MIAVCACICGSAQRLWPHARSPGVPPFGLGMFRLAHHRHHFDKESLKCQICSQVYQSMQDLENHMHIHANIDTYNCNACKLVFDTSHDLQEHVKTHKDLRNENCSGVSICDAGFLTATRLKRHEYIHTRDTSYDDRPFSCTVCTKAFRRKDTLYSHMKVHTTERLHSCSDCGRTFKKSNDRNRHRRNNCKISLANGQPPTVYSCPICKKSFESSASASNHLAFVHVLNKNSTEENSMPIGTDEPIISNVGQKRHPPPCGALVGAEVIPWIENEVREPS
uniref:C2H2-type domain-containing protein n=1 Tax=Timema tahoe TaxID=61484 RepID=A0A7R9IM81_9NEOP|nr:unnamed protein product [Timema tahoe]